MDKEKEKLRRLVSLSLGGKEDRREKCVCVIQLEHNPITLGEYLSILLTGFKAKVRRGGGS